MAQTHWPVELPFPPPRVFGFTGLFLVFLQHQESPPLGRHLQSSCRRPVCSLCCLSNNTLLKEYSAFWVLRVTGHPHTLHCGRLSIHTEHLSLSKLEPPFLIQFSVRFAKSRSDHASLLPFSPPTPFPVSFHHLPQEPKRKKGEGEVHNHKTRLIRFHRRPF